MLLRLSGPRLSPQTPACVCSLWGQCPCHFAVSVVPPCSMNAVQETRSHPGQQNSSLSGAGALLSHGPAVSRKSRLATQSFSTLLCLTWLCLCLSQGILTCAGGDVVQESQRLQLRERLLFLHCSMGLSEQCNEHGAVGRPHNLLMHSHALEIHTCAHITSGTLLPSHTQTQISSCALMDTDS